jgi:3-hydroxybutyryl-CoA dehydrogenase
VLETVSENLETKHAVFESAVENAPADAVLATNTSSLRVSDIAAGVSDEAHRVVGCHWWNPPYLLAPVEVVRGEATSAETVARTAEFVERAKHDPILVERDIPGFVWNRIQFAVLRECAHLVSEGVASIEDVDRAIRDGYARRTAVLGPFETADLAGLDLFATIAEELYPHLADDDAPNELFDERLVAGRGGVEDGAGFYEYDDPDGATRRRDEGLAALRRALGIEA